MLKFEDCLFTEAVPEFRFVTNGEGDAFCQMAKVRGACGNLVWRGTEPFSVMKLEEAERLHGFQVQVAHQEPYRGTVRFHLTLH